MKERDKKERRGPPVGTRTGPRARALQDRTVGNPYQRAERPARGEAPRERMHVASAGAIRLDPDVARVLRLQYAFGLRVQEASLLNLARAGLKRLRSVRQVRSGDAKSLYPPSRR